LRPEIGFGLGVIDVKVMGQGRIRYIHPDCGFWMLKRNIADGKIRALVQGRNLYEGK
jgi:5-methyltetrahydropteroyltriglutamate--homocysteine methyltransferase